MKRARKRPDDARVNAPLISWKVALSIFGIAYLLLVGQAGILAAFLDQVPTLIVVLAHYVVCTCVLLAVLFGVFWRYGVGKPLRILSQAARKVAAGDFSVQIPPVRRDGKKDELEVLIEDFNTMARELAGNEMLKSDFIANVSHEIKTPLSIIQSYTKALKDGCVPEAQKEQYMDAILAASSNLSLMVTNILKLNKLENQQIFPAPESYPLGEQLRLCALGFMERWQEKDIAFSIDVADVTVRYDPSLLELVWNNLLSNAIKFTPRGGAIVLTSHTEGNKVFVTVRDTGCGMDAQSQQKMFEKFYQGDPSHAVEGNGLGLALVKKVLEIVGGEISVRSSPGEGSAFTVALETGAAPAHIS